MAEAWARHLHGDRIEAHSAGTAPKPVDPRATWVMREVGIDLTGHRSKPLDEEIGLDFDLVVTVCAKASESCPAFPGTARRLHAEFDDPPRLAMTATTEDEALVPYRRVRDEIRDFVASLPGMR